MRPLPSTAHTHTHPLASLQSTPNRHLTFWHRPPNIGGFLTPSLRVQKPETSLLTVLPTDVDRWADPTGAQLHFGAQPRRHIKVEWTTDVSKYSSSFDFRGRISWTRFGLKVELQGTDVCGTSLVFPLSPSSACTRSNVLSPLNVVSTPRVVIFPFLVVKKRRKGEQRGGMGGGWLRR
ncbi:hypothetical protein K443DRAFT_13810 [Laccaria amethystina LaAM-08-1]|uniref:Unplaced genomic scaffold K443scaffold_397, whole genome shotgun sequence n=1 Tax=Laccaria amethystina LaAM-08-1 TaxID=1095629 RepID=A0A0C9X6U6_9AGAR|nr:hypothetical protein K443DRAFT_13810 [Laccaria amethystina LaAM-08-1]